MKNDNILKAMDRDLWALGGNIQHTAEIEGDISLCDATLVVMSTVARLNFMDIPEDTKFHILAEITGIIAGATLMEDAIIAQKQASKAKMN